MKTIARYRPNSSRGVEGGLERASNPNQFVFVQFNGFAHRILFSPHQTWLLSIPILQPLHLPPPSLYRLSSSCEGPTHYLPTLPLHHTSTSLLAEHILQPGDPTLLPPYLDPSTLQFSSHKCRKMIGF